MRLHKQLFFVAALALAATACSDDTPQESTKVPTGTTGNGSDADDNSSSSGTTGDVVSPTPSFTCLTKSVSVNASVTYQQMEGFGASDCWLPNQIGQYWTNNRLQLARWLFSQSISTSGQPQGIGLSMWRVNLGAGTFEQGEASGIDANNRAESYLSSDGTYNWNRCAGQRYFMQQAKNNGCESIVLFSNSPLVQYTLNGKGYSQNGANANLRDDAYTPFAEYMATVAQHFTQEGYPVTHISPVNEPQYDWDGTSQEGSGWQNTEVARLTRELDKALTAKGLDTEILVGEAGAWDCLYSGSESDRKNTAYAFYDAASESYIGDLSHVHRLLSGHSYWTFDNWTTLRNVRGQVATAAQKYNLRVWQTEWSMLDACPSELGGNYDTLSEFDIAMYMAKVIHTDLTVAGCSSWSYWTAMSVERWSQKNRFELIKTTPAGGNYSDDFTKEGNVEATPNLWILGNYSLFVRPGYQRVELTLDETKDFFGSAWMAPDRSRLVVVLSNFNKERGVMLSQTGQLPSEAKSVYTYTTTADKHLKQAQFNVRDQVFVDPYSTTTIVYNF
jgi:O-glycosyl hydrolase